MKRFSLLSVILMVISCIKVQATTDVYSWQSPAGVIYENGGVIEQHNGLDTNHINVLSSGYYTIQLCGRKENMADTDNSLASVYFTLTLDDGKIFKAGDAISVTAMRNNDDGGKSNLHIIYNSGSLTSPVIYDDTNTWGNLGQKHEDNSGGGNSGESHGGASTETLHIYSLSPSTNTFIVPEAADGCATISLTRNESECMLYITKIKITREETTEITDVNENRVYTETSRSSKVIEHGRIVIHKNGLKYNAVGQRMQL